MATDDPATQLTEGLFPAPSAFGAAGTPSMVISFADCSGAFDVCSGEATGAVTTNVGGNLPAADGIADVAATGLTLSAGVNNFRVFVQGNGPAIAATNPVIGLSSGATPLKAGHADRLSDPCRDSGERGRYGVCDLGRSAGRTWQEPEPDGDGSVVLPGCVSRGSGERISWICEGTPCRIRRHREGT